MATHACSSCGHFFFPKPTVCFWCRTAADPHHNREQLIKAGLHPKVVDSMEERVERERAARKQRRRGKVAPLEPELV